MTQAPLLLARASRRVARNIQTIQPKGALSVVGTRCAVAEPAVALGQGVEVSAREDVDIDSICICIPIPPEIEGVPEIPGNGEPHVTMLYIGTGSMEDAWKLCDLVESENASLLGEQMALGELGHFDRDQVVVAHATVLVSPAIAHARERLLAAVEAAGFEPKHHPGPWRPHATLEYLEPGSTYKGSVPTGSWVCTGAEVWRGPDRFVNGAHGDKLSRRGSKWIVLNQAGDKELGSYDTEKEARERLRQIEAAKAATADQGSRFSLDQLRRVAEGLKPVGSSRSDALDEETIKRWLVEHITGERKMPLPRMQKLKELEDEYAFLKPPEVTTVYRGLYNVPKSVAGKLVGPSNATRDKSWTTKLEVAAKFASTQWCDEEPKDGCVGVVLVADVDPSQLLLNHEDLAQLPGVFDQFDERWGETLENAIRDEAEVLAIGPLQVRTVKLVDMCSMEDGKGQERLVQDAAQARRHPAVITAPKTKIEIVRADTAILMEPEYHPDGWVEYTVFYSRAGNVQVYDGLREWRPRAEVFSQKSLDSGRGGPWELRHSSSLLTPRTVLGVVRGCMRTFERHPDNNHTWGRAKAWDQGLLDAIGTREEPGPAQEVSLAYRTLIDRRHGTSDDGDEFDQIATEIIINSLASEPKGRAGPTARVYMDSAPGAVDPADVVTRADAMLQLADGVPSRTLYFDPASWVRYDSGGTSSKKDDEHVPMPTPLMKLIMLLLESHGLTTTTAAEKLGVPESDFTAMLEDPNIDESKLTEIAGILTPMPAQDAPSIEPPSEEPDDRQKMMQEMMAEMSSPQMDKGKVQAMFDKMMGRPPGEGEPPMRKDADTEVEIGGKKFMVDAAVAAELEKLRKSSTEAGARADAAQRKLSESDMIPRADAAAMAIEQGLVIGGTIALARASYGQDFQPEPGKLGDHIEKRRPAPRADADGKSVPVLMREDWEFAALTGALGEIDGAAEFAKIMRAPEAARSALMEMRLDDARKVVELRSHKSSEVFDSIARMRAQKAEEKANERDRVDANDDPLGDAIDHQTEVAGSTRRADAKP